MRNSTMCVLILLNLFIGITIGRVTTISPTLSAIHSSDKNSLKEFSDSDTSPPSLLTSSLRIQQCREGCLKKVIWINLINHTYFVDAEQNQICVLYLIQNKKKK